MSGALAKLNADIDKMPTSITTPAPQLQAMPKLPSEAPSTPYKGLETWGTVLALLGSLRTSNPMTAAIGAAGAAMTAWNRRRFTDYRTEMQKYQLQMRSALANNQNLLALYRADIERNKDNGALMLDKLKARAAAEGDAIALDRLNQEGMLGLARLNVMRETAGARLAIANQQLAYNERIGGLKLITPFLAQGEPIPPAIADAAGIPEDQRKALSASASGEWGPAKSANSLAEYTLLTGKSPPMGMGNNATRRLYLEALAKKFGASDAQPGRIVQAQGALKAANQAMDRVADMSGAVNAFEGTARANIGLVQQLAKSGAAGGGSEFLNTPIQLLRGRFGGSPAVASLNAAILAARDEYARVLTTTTGGGGAQTSDAARKEADEIFNANMTPAQLASVSQTMVTEMANRERSNARSFNSLQAYVGNVATAIHNNTPLPAFPMPSMPPSPGTKPMAPMFNLGAAPRQASGNPLAHVPPGALAYMRSHLTDPLALKQFGEKYGTAAALAIEGQR